MNTSARQRGFTLVSAIFILVVLAALAAFMVVISTTQQIGSALDVQGARAYQAARAGVEWGVFQVWNSSPADRSGASCPAATSSFSPPATTMSGFVVTVRCTKTVDASGGPTIFTIEAWACNAPLAGWTATTAACPGSPGGAGYIERYIKATI